MRDERRKMYGTLENNFEAVLEQRASAGEVVGVGARDGARAIVVG